MRGIGQPESIFWLNEGTQLTARRIRTSRSSLSCMVVTVLPAYAVLRVAGGTYKKWPDLVLGQNSLIFALKFTLAGVSVAPNPRTAGVLDE